MLGLSVVLFSSVTLLATVRSSPVLNDHFPTGGELPIRTAACEIDRTEIVFPRIITTRAHGTRRKSSRSWEIGTELPSTFRVALTWRGRQRRLTLFQSDVAANRMTVMYEDNDHNDTVAEMDLEQCYYQGFLRGERTSYAALSTCNGLAGYIQTDDEMLFIEPAPAEREGSRLLKRRPHLIYTCKERDSLSGNFTDTGEPLPVISADPTPRRRRRSVGRKKYLEVKVVVDHTVVAMHGKERAKNYVMTLMNIANSVYQHHTLGINLRVVVTEIVLLNRQDQKYVVVKRDAYRTVQQFCQWSMYRQPPGQPVKHDIAVLLTRENMGPAGYAPITGLCNPSRSCAAITDEGFTSGFIIAHEMAHVFGLFHDGHGNHCHGRRYMSAIMAPLVEAKLNHYWWSECSKQRMQHVINYMFCLNDDPDMTSEVSHYELDSGYELANDLGKHWSLDLQCRLEFGDDFGLCATFPSDQCHMLWCAHRSAPHMCRTKRGPPAPGTSCGRDRVCRNSRCEYVGKEEAVNGNWSSWSDWEECSVDCGTGIKKRYRYCTDPKPAYGGNECEGESEMWDTCVAQECESYSDSREGHCAVWNTMNIRSGQHDWKPYQAKRESDRCKQTCISSWNREVVTLDVEVSDGTPCDYDNPTNICYLGNCLSVGCDGVRNSTKKYDSCGVCDGDNSQCKTVSGTFKRAPSKAEQYESVVFLPSGSRNIEIVHKGKAEHFLALKEADYGRYPLNGNKRRENSREFILAGARFEYRSRRDQQSILSRGPVHANLEVMLYPGKDLSPASVTYEYSIDKDDHTLEKRKYGWKFKGWSDCSVSCGDGVTVIVHTCYDKDSGDRVGNDKCQYLDPPRKDEAKCSREPCSRMRHNWAMTNDWSECSAKKCGETGVETQGYICELYFMDNSTYVRAKLEDCDPRTTPVETRNCSAPPCPKLKYNWTMTDDWSECSAEECGETGVETQGYICELFFTNNNTRVKAKPEDCDQHTTPTVTRNCSAPPCPKLKYNWTLTDDWSECSAEECDETGVETQGYICELYFINNNTRVKAKPEDCAQHTTPSVTRNCSAPPCPKLKYNWTLTDDWSECSAEECDETGVETQGYICELYFINNNTRVKAEPEDCAQHTTPSVTRNCSAPPCPKLKYNWTMSNDWSDCSAEKCGETGVETQGYFCELLFMNNNTRVKAKPEDCDQHTTPSVTRTCSAPPCPKLKWIIGKWSECSQTCGKGRQSRRVYCGDPDTDSDDIFCKDIPPPLSRTCEKKPCRGAQRGGSCQDKYSFCAKANGLNFKCKSKRFREICCKSCKKTRSAAQSPRRSRWSRYRMRMRRRRY